MFTISRVFGKVSDSDSLSRWIPYSSFIAPDVFVTKTGALGMTVAMDGIDYETKTQAQLESVSRQLLAANRVIGPKNRVYHHMIKRPGAKVQRKDRYENPTVDRLVSQRAEHLENKTGLFEIRLYTTILLEGVVGGKSAPTLSEQTAGALLDATLRDAIGQLRETVYAYTSHVGSLLGVTVLDKYGIFEHLSALLNPDFDSVHNSNLLYDEELNYFSGHTSIIRNRTTLTWGDSKAQVFVLREEPMATTAHMFRDLMLAPSGVIVCCEWKLTDKIATMQMLRSKRRRVNSQTRSAVQTAIDGDKSTNMVDASASENTEVLNQALRAMTNDQAYFTHFSMTVVVFDEREETLRQAAGKVKTVFAQYDAQIIKEDYHARRTFLAILPGNSPLNIRYRLLINTAVADLAPVYRSSTGSTQNTYLGDEYMTVLQTTEGTPFHLNLHHGQVGSTLVIGATGSGKSFLLDQLIDDSQKYDPYTILIDVGGSHRLVTKRHGGVYVQVDLRSRGFQMNPFMRLPYNPNSVNLIRELLNRLFLVDGYTPTAEEDKVLTDEINAVYCLSESRRKLSRLAISPKLRTKLHLWIEDGMFAHFFDGDRDDLSLTKFSTFDFTGLEDVPKLLGPLMFYMSSWVSNIVRDPANGPIPKGIWMDEGWRFGSLHDFILSSAKTFRKHRGWIVFATQDEEDLRTNDLLTVLNTSCHTKIFLSNPGADDAIYGTTFRLNERERGLLQSMQIGEGLVKTPVASHHIQYSVPPERLKEYHSQFFHAAV